MQLKWDDFDKEYKYLTVDGRKIILPKLLRDYIVELNRISKNIKTKFPFVLQKRKENKYIPMNDWNINDVFNSFTKISKEEKWEMFSPKYVRNGLILSLYAANYSIEDIMYITGIDINNISKYILREEMMKRVNKKTNWKPLYGGLLCSGLKE